MKFFFDRTKKLLAGVLLLFLLAACGDNNVSSSQSKGLAKGKRTEKAIPVEVANPEVGDAASYYVTTSTLTPSSDAKINARTNGVVRQILHEEGDDVAAGKTLLLLEDDDQRLRLKQARQNLNSAEREYKRLNKMKSAGVLSPAEWETANNNYLTAQTELELAELALAYTRVSSPFAGRIVWREIDLGAHVSSGDLLFRMMSIKPLLVRVHVPANRIGKVAVGQTVDLNVDSIKKSLQGVIELVSPIVDPATGTVKVTVRLDQYPVGVRPGDFTEVTMITDKRKDAMLLPSVAIIEERGQHYLFVNEGNKAVRKKVKTGYVVGDKTEVIQGITQSEYVVVKGQRNLNEGNLLKVISPGAETETSSDKTVQSKKIKDKPRKRTQS
ncbi:efflux RND transporter periplasmic adaptor subunit [Aliikangiella sp. IMCC44359]|uniref:efflux RND transporter periplasmic adaptor subunit n=1 Tax=Aliikangiella sp. IMCC44359 TaxID=3459125 RepID=UPI00403ADBF5